MDDGSDLPPFIRFYPDQRLIILMPHAFEEKGTYYLKLFAKEVDEGNLELEGSMEVKVTSTGKKTGFKTTPGPVEVAVGDDITFILPSISNNAQLDYKLTYEDGPEWARYYKNSKKFIFTPSLEDFLNGTLALGSNELLMNWNAETGATEFTGSYFGVEIVGSSAADDFYQDYILDVEVIEMPSTLTMSFGGIRNQTVPETAANETEEEGSGRRLQVSGGTNGHVTTEEGIIISMDWGQEVEFSTLSSLYESGDFSYQEVFDSLFTFEMKAGSSLPLPDIKLLSMDTKGLEFMISKSDASKYTEDELKDQVLLVTTQESYMVYSAESPRQKLMGSTIEVPLTTESEEEPVEEPEEEEPEEEEEEIIEPCAQDIKKFGFSYEYDLGISEGKKLTWEPF